MGCDIHCVLQKLNKDTGKYETVLKDVFPSRNYLFFTFLAGVRGVPTQYDDIGAKGFPVDFLAIEKDPGAYYHDGFYMGDHSFGHIDLEDFCDAELPEVNMGDRFEIDKFDSGLTVSFLDLEESDEYAQIRAIQVGLRCFLDPVEDSCGYGETYRLVYGFDS